MGDRIFINAEWRYLAMLNYRVAPDLLAPRIPVGTELDLFGDSAFVSLVGFRFISTKIFGISIPFHRNFEEVNLRFYVRRSEGGVTKRGVVFIQEIVPRRAVAAAACLAYNENYRYLPMAHEIEHSNGGVCVGYAWRLGTCWNGLTVRATGEPRPMKEGSAEQFIAEHYWGYCSQPGGGSLEYRVEHPPWRVWDVTGGEFSGDAEQLYGADFAAMFKKGPDSVLLAEGSPVTVYAGRRLE